MGVTGPDTAEATAALSIRVRFFVDEDDSGSPLSRGRFLLLPEGLSSSLEASGRGVTGSDSMLLAEGLSLSLGASSSSLSPP